MRTLRKGLKGKDVEAWQYFLRGQGVLILVDGVFGERTKKATIEFQKGFSLNADGVVGNETYAAAMLRGFELVKDDIVVQEGPNWPPPPDFKPLGSKGREKVFGKIRYKPAGNAKDPEAIILLDNWQQNNIVMVDIPQLKGVKGTYGKSSFPFNIDVAESVQELFKAWEKAGLKDRILTYAGSWVPRFIRGSRTHLSNHAYGTAFDINVAWNYLGTQPALVGKKGCVRELVPIANDLGWYWGGHFKRKDGMHLEVAEL
jgi:hypothetical protein